MRREFESSLHEAAGVTISESSAYWTEVLHSADAKQNEAFKRFHDWFYGLMDPEDERCYTDAVMIATSGLKSEGKS